MARGNDGRWIAYGPSHLSFASNESENESHSVMFDSLRPHGLHSPWNSSGQNSGVDSLSLPQGIFPTQGSNPGLPHCRWILYQLSYQGSHIFEMVVYDLKYCSIVMFSNMWSLNICKWAFQVALVAKNTPCQCRRHKRCGFDPWVRKIPWRKAWQPTSILPWRIPWKEEPGGL